MDPSTQQAPRHRLAGRARSAAAVRAAEDADRRAARRRLADAGRARAGAGRAACRSTTIAARLMGDWPPTGRVVRDLAVARSHRRRSVAAVSVLSRRRRSRMSPSTLGDPADWLVEWKWDGIRAQLVRRGGAVHLWSRGEELITHRFPEIAAAATHLPDGTVLDGEVLAFRDDRPLPFSALQQRIGRQKQVAQMARDGPGRVHDLRRARAGRAGHPRRARSPSGARGSSALLGRSRPRRAAASPAGRRRRAGTSSRRCAPSSRARGVEGLMLKRASTRPYGVGRKRGDWWKWKIEPLHDRRGADLRAAGQRQARQPAHRLHVRRLARRRAGADRQGLLRAVERGDRRAGSLDPPAHARALRAGAPRRAGAGLRARIRRRSPRRRGIARASPCGFRACCAGARTSARRRPTRSRTCGGCWSRWNLDDCLVPVIARGMTAYACHDACGGPTDDTTRLTC